MDREQWIAAFGEPEPHVPENVVASSFVRLAEPAGDAAASIARRVELAQTCESPIEIDLAAELELLRDLKFKVVPQFRLAGFRYDFALTTNGGRPLFLVECDGKDFHSTPEQIANDRRKDNSAEAAGLPLLRFTGSEIFRSPKRVAEHVANLARIMAWRHS